MAFPRGFEPPAHSLGITMLKKAYIHNISLYFNNLHKKDIATFNTIYSQINAY